MAYQVFVIILLLNMLIAVFTNTYDKVKNESKVFWSTDRFELVSSLMHPLPLGIWNPFFQLFLFIWTPIAFILALARHVL